MTADVTDPSRISVLPSSLPYVPFDKRDGLPQQRGIYLAMSEDGTVLYVGSTKNLRTRWMSHNRINELEDLSCTTIHYYLCQSDKIRDLEQSFIFQFKPPLNSYYKKSDPKLLQQSSESNNNDIEAKGFHNRLQLLQQHTGKTRIEFALYIGVSQKSMTRYLIGTQVPAGLEMFKIARKFPDQISWLLTGRETTDVHVLQEIMAGLSTEDQANVMMCAHVLASGNEGLVGIIRAVMTAAKQTFDIALSVVRPGRIA